MLWKVLSIFSCPDHFEKIVREFHIGTKGKVAVSNKVSEDIQVSHGTKKGCVQASTMFALFLTVVLMILYQSVSEGVYIRTRDEGTNTLGTDNRTSLCRGYCFDSA